MGLNDLAAGKPKYHTHGGPGREIQKKPEHIELKGEKNWEELSSHRRWCLKQQHKNEKLIENIKRWLSCEECGESRAPTLDFHHISSSDKRGEISHIKKLVSFDIFREELRKCDLICSNCHRVIHAK